MSSTTEPQYDVRTCTKCGVTDSEPRHVTYSVDADLSKHIACCAEDGCEICAADIEASGGNADRQFLQNRPDDLKQKLHDELGVEVLTKEA